MSIEILSELEGRIGSLMQTLEGLKAENAALREAANRVDGLSGEVEGLRGEIDGLNGEKAALQGEIDGLRGENADLKTCVDNLQDEREVLNRQIDELKAAADGQRSKAEEVAERLKRMLAQIDSAQQQ